LEYKIINFCNYLKIYYQIKIKYDLSLQNNKPSLFNKCFIKIKN